MKKMRKMKKMMSVFAAAALALTALPAAVFAADSAGLEQAIATAKFKIEIPAEYTEFDSFIQEDDRMEKNYELRWSTKGDDYTSAKSIEVSINSHGDVISYWTSSDSYDGDVQFAAYNGQQLRDIAREWLFGVNPGWADELPEDAINYAPYSDLRSRTENVSFERRVNGLPFCSNRVSVSVNTATGQVTGMWANWNYEASVPDPASAMENEAAQKAFLGLSPLELQYINTGDDHGVLAYVPAHAYALVDAVTGKEMVQGSARYSGGGASTKNAMSEAAADQAADAGGYRLTEAELSNVEEIAGLKSQEELKNIAAGLANTGLDTAQFESCRYARAYSKDENVPAEYHATLRFLFQPGTEQECSGIVVLDAKTGQLQGYNSYTMRDYVSSESVARANTVTYDQARAAADAFARAYGGDEYAFAQLVPAEDEEQAMKYHPYFEFRRIENGVPYPNNSLNVSVDETSGRVLGFHKNWDKTMTFETTEGVIDTEAAQKALM